MIKNTKKEDTSKSWNESNKLGYGDVASLNVEQPVVLEDFGFRRSSKNPEATVFHFRVLGNTYAVTAKSVDKGLMIEKNGMITYSGKKVIIINGKIQEAVAEVA